jgi:hypothetical protein
VSGFVARVQAFYKENLQVLSEPGDFLLFVMAVSVNERVVSGIYYTGNSKLIQH